VSRQPNSDAIQVRANTVVPGALMHESSELGDAVIARHRHQHEVSDYVSVEQCDEMNAANEDCIQPSLESARLFWRKTLRRSFWMEVCIENVDCTTVVRIERPKDHVLALHRRKCERSRGFLGHFERPAPF
jgi:hypothetical protein